MHSSPQHAVASMDDAKIARAALLDDEKQMTRALDALAARRRRLPWVKVSKSYSFTGVNGAATLDDLFAGRRQLIIYHHMLRPQDPAPCPGCCMFTDNIGELAHLNARNTSLVIVARAPFDEIAAFRLRMGWSMPWFTTHDDFNADFGVTHGFGLNVFIENEGVIYNTYFTSGRGVERLNSVWDFLDITPLGRQERWEDSPDGTPRTEPYRWWRLHDDYDLPGAADC